jgi:hypothetical protein
MPIELAMTMRRRTPYQAGISSDGKTLTFTYTVASTDANVASLQVTSITLPTGATIQDGGGNNLNLSLSAVPTYSGPQIDTTDFHAPSKTGVKLCIAISAVGRPACRLRSSSVSIRSW